MLISAFLSKQAPERKDILSAIHKIIVEADKKVNADMGNMMAKEMIIYTAAGVFKYGLSSVKTHMSLHLMPIYCVPELHSRYQALLNKARFQKGCINFKDAGEMQLDIVKQLIDDCANVDLLAIMEDLKKQRALK